MPEYIERENAYKLISEQKEKETGMYSKGRNRGLNIAKSIIHSKEQCPTVEAVAVVRCGQCKNWKINPNNLYGGQCRFSECASIDHFCSRGERKERKDGAKNG